MKYLISLLLLVNLTCAETPKPIDLSTNSAFQLASPGATQEPEQNVVSSREISTQSTTNTSITPMQVLTAPIVAVGIAGLAVGGSIGYAVHGAKEGVKSAFKALGDMFSNDDNKQEVDNNNTTKQQ